MFDLTQTVEMHPRQALALVEVNLMAAEVAVVVAVKKLGVSCQQEVTCQVEENQEMEVDHMLEVVVEEVVVAFHYILPVALKKLWPMEHVEVVVAWGPAAPLAGALLACTAALLAEA